MSSPEAAAEFFASYWPEAQAIGDPEQTLYQAFEIKAGSLFEFFRPQVLKAFWPNRHHGIGAPRGGNTLRYPDVLLIENLQVQFMQTADHIGMQVDVEAIQQLSAKR